MPLGPWSHERTRGPNSSTRCSRGEAPPSPAPDAYAARLRPEHQTSPRAGRLARGRARRISVAGRLGRGRATELRRGGSASRFRLSESSGTRVERVLRPFDLPHAAVGFQRDHGWRPAWKSTNDYQVDVRELQGTPQPTRPDHRLRASQPDHHRLRPRNTAIGTRTLEGLTGRS